MLGNFNYFVAQWFFIRFFQELDNKKVVGFGIMGPIFPLTGWVRLGIYPIYYPDKKWRKYFYLWRK